MRRMMPIASIAAETTAVMLSVATGYRTAAVERDCLLNALRSDVTCSLPMPEEGKAKFGLAAGVKRLCTLAPSHGPSSTTVSRTTKETSLPSARLPRRSLVAFAAHARNRCR